MTKREAKIEALKRIGGMYLVLTETNIYEEYTELEEQNNKKVILEIENICFDMLDRADKLKSKSIKK